MSPDLLNQLRRNRELRVKVGKFTFICSRPTAYEFIGVQASAAVGGQKVAEIAMKFVTGWEGVVEDDIVGGGGQVVVAFDADLWRDWCAERSDFWGPIFDLLYTEYTKRQNQLEGAKGN